jgi:ornithine cyclodeaminase/alanine dehydrogenase-like protein (mu-crystallin family)
MRLISADDLRAALTWEKAMEALRSGHQSPRPVTRDMLLQDGAFSLFGRGVVMAGHGAGMKVAAIFPPNAARTPPGPSEDALFLLIGEDSRRIELVVDGPELTRWKTGADSGLGSRLLSREDSRTLLVIGAGPVATALCRAHLVARPGISEVLLWNRTPERSHPLKDEVARNGRKVTIVSDMADAVSRADIITSATASTVPLVLGQWVNPGCHVDLVGSYAPHMREADDDLMARAQVYVDYRATALDGPGDISGPLQSGALTPDAIRGDLFDMVRAAPNRAPQDITVYKNAGGAHLDLLVASLLC